MGGCRREIDRVVGVEGAQSFKGCVQRKKSCAIGFDAVPAGVWVVLSASTNPAAGNKARV